MQRSIYKHLILDTIAVTGDDILVKNGILYIAGTPIFKFDDVARNSVNKVAGVSSETAGVVTYSMASSVLNSTTYSITIRVANPNAEGAQQDPILFNVSVQTPATGSLTNITLFDQFRAKLAGIAYTPYFTTNGTGNATLVLTAVSGYPVITGNATSPITVAQTTQGVQITGTPTTMATIGAGDNINTVWLSGTQGTFAGTLYDLYYSLEYQEVGESNAARVNLGSQTCLWVNAGATNKSTFETALESVLAGGTKTSATTANPSDDAVME